MTRFGFDLVKLLCLAFLCGQLIRADMLRWTGRCCVKGRRKAMDNSEKTNICESDDLDKRSLPSTLIRVICRHMERVCCTRELSRRSCELGKYHAFQGQSCGQRRGHVGGDTFRECCDCCALGLRAHSMGVTRDYLIRSNPCDEVFKECLKGTPIGGVSTLPVNPQTTPVTTPAITRVQVPSTDSSLTECDQVPCQHVCRYSSIKGAVCYCNRGYMIQSDGRSCTDVNECAYPGVCNDGQICRNKMGTYQCVPSTASCDEGRERKNGTGCQDIDECSSGKASCGSLQSCVNTDGSYTCHCRRGYEAVPGSERDCQDQDECSLGRHNCRQGTVCKNIAGSFSCLPIPSCGSGKRYENSKCVDINECTERSSACPADEICKNTQGSYVCECRAGHTRNSRTRKCAASAAVCDRVTCPKGSKCREYGNQYRCEDIDECQENPSMCSVNEKCQNTVGSYSCQCLPGFTKNTTTQKCEGHTSPCTGVRCRYGHKCVAISDTQHRCEDIDECSQSPSVCKADEECLNRPGYYYCRCPRGYEKKGDRCQDKDECRANYCQHNCRNTDGSYVCTCRHGFKLSSDDRSCLDIDECDGNPCDHKCYNMYGKYRCGCKTGFKLASNNHTCTDINECEASGNRRICMHECQNTAGSYRCTCPPGYRSYTWACSDINECKTPGTCSDPGTYCFNTHGGHRCLPKVVCPEFFKKAYENKCQKSCPPDRDERCEAIVDKSFSEYSYALRSKQTPFRMLAYQIFVTGYEENPPLVRYRFSSGNDDGAFEIRNKAKFRTEVWQTHAIVGPKSYRLSFDGEVVRNGKVISRYVNQMYIFVSANEI